MPPTSSRFVPLATCLALAVLVAVALRAARPPAPLPADAPPQAFSAARAWRHVEALAREPRPVGSAAHGRARALLEAELRALGAEVEVQRTTSVDARYGVPFDSASVANVVARLPGTASSGAVALVAHYDSVPNSPGAADDASGVAVLLETLRALKASGPLRNDVLLVFTDAEEGGVLGSTAFVRQHPRAREVAVVLNFDARGGEGPAQLVGLTEDSRWLVDALAEAVPHPTAASIFTEGARRTMRGTDWAPFTEAGVAGLNLLSIDGTAHYHAATDGPAALSPATLQHLGEHALGLARHLGGRDLSCARRVAQGPGGAAAQASAPPCPAGAELRRGGSVFFVLGGRLWAYPRGWVAPLTVLLVLAAAAGVAAARRRRGLRLRGVALGAGALLGLAALVPLAVWGSWRGLAALLASLGVLRGADPLAPGAFRLGLTLLAVALTSAALLRLERRVPLPALGFGMAAVWTALTAVASLAWPGAHALAALAAAGVLLGLAAHLRREGADAGGATAAPLALLAGAPALLLGVPLLQTSHAALGLSAVWAPALIAVLLTGALVFPLSGARFAPALCGVLALGSLAWGAVDERSRERPPALSLVYALDAETGRASWLSENRRPDALASVLGPAPRREAGRFLGDTGEALWTADAPLLPLPAPQVDVLEDRTEEGARLLRLRLRSPRGAPWVWLFFEGEVRVRRASVDGVPVRLEGDAGRVWPGERWGLTHRGLPAEGLELSLLLEAPAPGPLALTVVDRSEGLPAPGRPPGSVPAARSWIAESTLVRAALRL
jgi:hypothetical protein